MARPARVPPTHEEPQHYRAGRLLVPYRVEFSKHPGEVYELDPDPDTDLLLSIVSVQATFGEALKAAQADTDEQDAALEGRVRQAMAEGKECIRQLILARVKVNGRGDVVEREPSNGPEPFRIGQGEMFEVFAVCNGQISPTQDALEVIADLPQDEKAGSEGGVPLPAHSRTPSSPSATQSSGRRTGGKASPGASQKRTSAKRRAA